MLSIAILVFVVVLRDSVGLVGGTFPGFFVWENGVVPALHLESWTGARAGLRADTRIVAFDDRPLTSATELWAHVRSLPEGSPVAYRVRDGSHEHTIEVETQHFGWVEYGSTFGLYLLNAAVLFLVAFVAVLLRPDRSAAHALALAGTCLGSVLALSIDFVTAYRATGLYVVLEALAPATFTFVALAFPVERGSSALRRGLALGVAVPLLGLALGQSLLFDADPERALALNSVVYGALVLGVLGMLTSLLAAWIRPPTLVERFDVGIVLGGAIVSGLVPTVTIAAVLLLGWRLSFTWIVAPIALLPLSVLYAVTRRDLLAAERFIRLTVGYSVASSALVVGYAALIFSVDRWLLTGVAEQPVVIFGLLLALALGLDPIRTRVQAGIDRAFFRTRVDPARTLEATSTVLAALTDEAAIVEEVEQQLGAALDLEHVTVLLEPESGVTERVPVGPVQPIRFRQETLGTIVCGEKRSRAPFSAAELELVRGIANQAAVALRNARALAELRETQAALLRSERLAAIGELAGAVAHGLRNPLAGIRAATQVAREEVEAESPREMLADVLSEVDRAELRVRTLLDFSKPFEPKLQTVDLAALLAMIANGLAARAKAAAIEIRVQQEPGAWQQQTDPLLLEEALQELIGNAFHAIGKDGEIKLALSNERGQVCLRVADTGNGIPEAVQGRIFDLFFSTRPQGTGMGLATVRKLIHRLGATIELERSDTRGTSFLITWRD